MPNIPLISIVDDDDSLRGSIENLIRSGISGTRLLFGEAFLASNKMHETACLILDVRMPGMSGFKLQRVLAAANSHLPIIFISAHANDDPRTRALEAGAVAFLYKPFYEEELLNAIDLALKGS